VRRQTYRERCSDSFRLEIQDFYNDLRQDVETVLCALFVDDSSTIAVSPEKIIREEWRNLILSALEMIVHGDDSMNDATGDDATDNATVEVDEVLDKILDNAIEAYGSSARDVYGAIFFKAVAENLISVALSGQKYDDLRDTTVRLERADASNTFSHSIFTMQVEPLGNAPSQDISWFRSPV
jgi:hypothetical protein